MLPMTKSIFTSKQSLAHPKESFRRQSQEKTPNCFLVFHPKVFSFLLTCAAFCNSSKIRLFCRIPYRRQIGVISIAWRRR